MQQVNVDQQVMHYRSGKWTDWRMVKDVKRRLCLVEHGAERMRLKAIKKNDLLPVEIREVGFKMMDALPRDSSIIRIRNRCAFTSRPRGIVTRWRLSRIAWRHLADYNQLSGVQRAIW
uniref:28S ribosomal protein S14, mitochondrial n=1 Tax=Eubosmina coregoni TaxID=186181 RepID=A0A4Y7LLY0_9CRUS|nr:EOG090X0MNX [Eubosmina coregoni]SVE70218.1 EOG090X0MNX [Eubosmina coregoni]